MCVCVCVLTANLFTLFLAVRHLVLEEGVEIGGGGGKRRKGVVVVVYYGMQYKSRC